MPPQGTVVEVIGLRELRKDLRKLGGTTNRELSKELRRVIVPVAALARARAVKRTGRYAASLKPFVVGTRAGVRSNLPQANVLHWGGTIYPKGVPITFPRRPVISEAIDALDHRIVADIGDAVEKAAKKLGWH